MLKQRLRKRRHLATPNGRLNKRFQKARRERRRATEKDLQTINKLMEVLTGG